MQKSFTSCKRVFLFFQTEYVITIVIIGNLEIIISIIIVIYLSLSNFILLLLLLLLLLLILIIIIVSLYFQKAF